MRSQIRLGQVFSIKIGLHYSWLLIALLIIVSLISTFHEQHPQWSYPLIFTLAIVTSLLFFISLLLHELAHSVVAKSRGLPVSGITLFALGGVSQIEKEPSDAWDEFMIALVGPATSAIIGLVCLLVAFLIPSGTQALAPERLMLLWLGYINIGLCLFNLIPGYPMDGGRILRALIWWRTGSMDRSTRDAGRVGQTIAILFIIFGILSCFHGGGIGSLWIAFIGWFLLQAARESVVEAALRKSLLDHTVREFMSQSYPQVDRNESVQHFVDNTLLHTGQRAAIVTEGASPVGVVTLKAIKHVDRSRWPVLPIERIMLPISVSAVTPGTTILSAVQTMEENSLDLLPVVSDGAMEGVVSRDDLLGRARALIELQRL